jgi:hypothetical protein
MTGVAQSGPLVAEPEVLPQYPEGTTGLYSFINDQMRYSDEDRTAGIEGEMIVTFIVRQDGRLSDVEIKKGLSPGINSEIRTVIGKMPDWRPGRSGGQWVSARYSLAMKIDAATGTARPLF